MQRVGMPRLKKRKTHLNFKNISGTFVKLRRRCDRALCGLKDCLSQAFTGHGTRKGRLPRCVCARRRNSKVRRGIYCESSTQWRSLASRDPRRPNSNEAIRPPLGDLPRDQRERDDRKQHQQDNAHQIGRNEEQHGAVGFCHRCRAVHRIDNEQVHTNWRRD